MAVRASELFLLSCPSEEKLREAAGRMASALRSPQAPAFAAACATLAACRERHPYRLAVTAADNEEAAAQLSKFATTGEMPTGVCSGRAMSAVAPAFLFTGQGSQYAGAGAGLYAGQPVFRAVLDECARILDRSLERPLLELLFGPAAEQSLRQTRYAQPALLSLEYSLVALWRSWGVRPTLLIGHSIGELTAAAVAGVFSIEDALRLAALRGRLMQDAPKHGGMMAVMAEYAVVERAVRDSGVAVDIAADNSPGETVVAGTEEALARLRAALEKQRLACMALAVSHSFHSRLMDPILERFGEEAARLPMHAPRLPIVSNLTGRLADPDEIATPDYWVRQIRQKVRFREGLETCLTQGCSAMVEIGPRPLLLRLARETLGERAPPLFASIERGSDERARMLESLGALFTLGVEPTFCDGPDAAAGGAAGNADAGEAATATPASRTEQAFLLADSLHRVEGQYNIAMAFRLRGWLDIAALRSALGELVMRHSALRTRIDGSQVRVKTRGEPELAVFDMTALDRDAQEALVQRFHDRPFRVTEAPLWRLGLFLDGAEQVLCLTMHHAIGDFTSLETALLELEALYGRRIREDSDALPLAPQAEDVREKESALLAGVSAVRSRAFWAEQLASLPPKLRWPEPATPMGVARSVHFTLGNALTAAVAEFCQSQRVGLNAVLLAAWLELLGRYSGERECIVGVPASLRSPGLLNAIACAVTILPVRLQADADEVFATRVARVRDQLAAALYNRLPIPDILAQADIPATERGVPPYQVLFSLQQPRKESRLGEVYLAREETGADICWGSFDIAPWPLNQQEEQVDLCLEAVASDDEIHCAVKGARAAVHSDLLRELSRAFPEFLAATLACRTTPSGLIGLEQGDILPGRRRTAPSSQGRTIIERFLRIADARPDAEAVVDGDVSLSYSVLASVSHRLALQLAASGGGPNMRVAVCLPPSIAAVVAKLAILRAGSAYVPISPHMPRARAAAILSAGGCRVAVTDARGRTLLPETVTCLYVPDPTGGARAEPASAEAPRPGEPTLAYTIFTSGTTGTPKGVDVSHGALVVMLDAMTDVIDVSDKDRWAWLHDSGFDMSVWEIWGALGTGGTLVVMPEEVRGVPDLQFEELQRSQATVVAQTPTGLALLAGECDRRGADRLPIRQLLVCGEALPGALARRMIDRVGALWNLYGVAEGTVFSTIVKVDPAQADFDIVPLGPTLASAAIRLVDDRGRGVARFVEGEIELAGPALAVGYVGGDPAGKFADAADLPGGRRYRTGDLAMWDGEALHYRGRRDLMVKLRGHRIELGEVESALRSCEGVQEAAVVVEASAEADVLIAFIVCRPETAFAPHSLRHRLRQLLPDYMIPARFEQRDSMPLTAHGKLDRRALARGTRPALPKPSASASSLVERIADVWRRVLRQKELDPDKPFFDMGGNSLRMMQVYETLRDWPECRTLSPSDLFHFPTLRSLSNQLASLAARQPVVAAQPARPKPENRAPRASGKIAIVGLEVRAPGARDTEAFVRHLRAGGVLRRLSEAEIAREVPPGRARDPRFVPVENRLEGRDLFDPQYFGLSAQEAELIDPQQRVMLLLARGLLERLGRAGEDDVRTGLFLAASFNTYLTNVLKARDCDLFSLDGTQIMLANDKDYMPGRIAFALGLTGPSVAVQTGCSSSLVAVHMAVRALQAGDCGMALAGGVSIHAHDHPGYCHEPNLMFSPDGQCRAFAPDAAGTPFADGAGLVALRRLEDAVEDGDPILAVILASGSNNDGGHRAGFAAPGVRGQKALIEDVLTRSGVAPGQVGYVEAHGTGTRLGDMVELSALTQAYGGTVREEACAIGTVKANFGHLAAAAGVAGLGSAVMAVRDGEIPRHPGFASALDRVALQETPFFVNIGRAKWPVGGRRIAAVSSFGLGGSNAHILIEQAPPLEKGRNGDSTAAGWTLAPVSATREYALGSLVEESALRIEASRLPNSVAATLQFGRRHRGWRCIAVGRDTAELAANLRRASFSGLARAGGVAVNLVTGDRADYSWLGGFLATDPAAVRRLIGRDAPSAVQIAGALAPAQGAPRARLAAHILAVDWFRRAIGDPSRLFGTGPVSAAACAFLDGEASFEEAFAGSALPPAPPPEAGLLIDLRSGAVARDGQPIAIMAGRSEAAPPWLLETVARAWLGGAQINWEALPGRAAQAPRIELPSERLSLAPCWAEQTPRSAAPPAPPTHGRCWAEQWVRVQRVVRPKAGSGAGRRILVVAGCAEEGRKLTASLAECGVDAILAEPSRQLRADTEISGIVYLPGIAPGASADACTPAVSQLLELAQALLRETDRPLQLDIVAHGLFDVLGSEPVDPGLAALSGAACVIPQEIPWLDVRVIDPGDPLLAGSDDVAAELLREGRGPVSAIRNGFVWARRFAPVAGEAPEPDFTEGDVLLVVGGLGRIGFTLGRQLALRYRLKLLLIGRTPPDRLADDPARAKRLANLRELGLAHRYVQADAGRADELRTAIAKSEKALGPVRGFIEAAGFAGEVGSGWIAQSSCEDFELIVAGKARPAINLAALLPPDRVALGLFTSSLSVVLGGQGLAAYAAAHAYVEALCMQPKARDRFLAVAWDNWGGDADRPEGTCATQARRDAAFSTDGAAGLLEALLRQVGRGRVLATRRDIAAPDPIAGPALPPLTTSAEDRSGRASEAAVSGGGRDLLRALWRAHTSPEGGEVDDFFAAGGDSLRAVIFARRINEAFGVDIRPQDIFAARRFETLFTAIAGEARGPNREIGVRGHERRERRGRRRIASRASHRP